MLQNSSIPDTNARKLLTLQLQQLVEWLSGTISSVHNIFLCFFTLTTQQCVLNKPFESQSNKCGSQPNDVFTVCYLDSISPNRFIFSFCDQRYQHLVGFLWRSLKYRLVGHNSPSCLNTTSRHNKGCCKLPPAANNHQMIV